MPRPDNHPGKGKGKGLERRFSQTAVEPCVMCGTADPEDFGRNTLQRGRNRRPSISGPQVKCLNCEQIVVPDE